MKKRLFIGLIGLMGLMSLIASVAFAQITISGEASQKNCGPQPNGGYILCTPIFGTKQIEIENLPDLIKKLFFAAFAIAGTVVFIRVVYGGFMIMLSAGNVVKQGEGRDIITQAILGLVLLLASVLILRGIDPNLTVVRDIGQFPQSARPRPESRAQGVEEALAQLRKSQNLQLQAAIKAKNGEMALIEQKIQSESAKAAPNQQALKELKLQALQKAQEREILSRDLWSHALQFHRQRMEELKNKAKVEELHTGTFGWWDYPNLAWQYLFDPYLGLSDADRRKADWAERFERKARFELGKINKRRELINKNSGDPEAWLRATNPATLPFQLDKPDDRYFFNMDLYFQLLARGLPRDQIGLLYKQYNDAFLQGYSSGGF